MPDRNDIEKMADEHDDKVDEGLDKLGDSLENKFGHGEQIDKAVDWAQDHTGGGDQTNQPG